MYAGNFPKRAVVAVSLSRYGRFTAWFLAFAVAVLLPGGCGEDDEVGSAPDTMPPAAVTNLSVASVTDSSATLAWEAPGDDGTSGTASAYDIRSSADSITVESWNAATPAADPPSPKEAGSGETFTFGGLDPGTTYYFALKTVDDEENWSPLSNVARDTTADGPPPDGMVYVPAGTFTMGSDPGEGGSDEEPEHTPYISAFYVDRLEVTNAMYASALNWALSQGLVEVVPEETYVRVRKAGGGEIYLEMEGLGDANNQCRVTYQDGVFGVEAGWEDHPVVYVTWLGAAAYCNWRSGEEGKFLCYDTDTWSCNFDLGGYRLPTEAEWEKAARGSSDERTYPWGEGIDCGLCNYDLCVGTTVEVDDPAYQNGASPYGLLHMLGNVWEWCNDWYSSAYYAISPDTDPRGREFGEHRVLRGGCWSFDETYVRCAGRGGTEATASLSEIGFRTAMSP